MMDTTNFFHSVTLDRDKCHGCINCVKRCPTEAIRVRNGKAKIIKRAVHRLRRVHPGLSAPRQAGDLRPHLGDGQLRI